MRNTLEYPLTADEASGLLAEAAEEAMNAGKDPASLRCGDMLPLALRECAAFVAAHPDLFAAHVARDKSAKTPVGTGRS